MATQIQNQEKLKFLGHMKKKGWENLTLTGHTERKKDSDLPTRRACVNGWRNGGDLSKRRKLTKVRRS